MRTLDRHFSDLATCLVVVDLDSGLVLDCFGSLPFSPADGVRGRDWRDALGVPADSSAIIAQALLAGSAAPLLPTIVGDGADGDYVVGGMLVPQEWEGHRAALLFLRQLSLPALCDPDGEIHTQDIVAVLGVDRLEFSPSWGALETERLMMELRGGLEQILREEDWIGIPEGASIPVILRGIEPDAALDISRALLSHLHQRLAGIEGGAQYARASIGLAQRLEGQTGLSALVAANAALLQAQALGEERIRFASPWDPQGLAARSLNFGGVFRDSTLSPGYRAYLQQLISLPVQSRKGPEYARDVLELTLAQPGLAGAAILRLQGGESEVVAAASRKGGEVKSVNGNRAPPWLQRGLRHLQKQSHEHRGPPEEAGLTILPLSGPDSPWGYLLLADEDGTHPGFRPGPAAQQYLCMRFRQCFARDPGAGAPPANAAPVREMERGIAGYVLDNMEGAIDQAVFLAQVDIPVAIIGERGTGKMYVAQVVHLEGGGKHDGLVKIDCRAFRSRADAWARISGELQQGEWRTLVFKSPQLLHAENQVKLARHLATRTVSDDKGSKYLARNRFVGLFPAELELLVRRGELDERLASVFAGYPILVPPLRERRRAVLRWAHKILEQECARTDRRVLGFTPDAEQALQQHDWPGNISEMRELICNALGHTDKEWLTPVDLGIYLGISADGHSVRARERPFLQLMQETPQEETAYTPSAEEELRLALGQALAASMETGVLRPLGTWLDDEILAAAAERFGEEKRACAEFLHTRTRNLGRWMPRVKEREAERDSSLLWQDARGLVRQWIKDVPSTDTPPQQLAQDMMLGLVVRECGGLSVAERAEIMGVSTPTYQKRLKQIRQNDGRDGDG